MRNYLDTNVASVYAALPPSGLIQQTQWVMTQLLWETAGKRGVRLITSDFVIGEARKGDAGAVRRRLNALRKTTIVEETSHMRRAAEGLWVHFNPGAVAALSADIRHYAIAATLRVDALVTWNIKHFNAIEVSIPEGAMPSRPRIVTPAELAFDLGSAVLPNPGAGGLLEKLNRPSPFVQKFIDEETRAGRELCRNGYRRVR